MFVGGVPTDMGEDVLRGHFEQFGEVCYLLTSQLLYLFTHSDCRMIRTSCLLYLCTHSDCRMTRTSCLLYLCTHSDCRMTRTSCLLYMCTHSDCRMTRKTSIVFVFTECCKPFSSVTVLQIEEVALVKEKGSDKRRGFIFVTFVHFEGVDECTKKAFHELGDGEV